MDALRTAVSAWGADSGSLWPPTVEQARALTALAPSALAAFARLRDGMRADRARPVAGPGRGLPLPAHRRAARPGRRARARRLLHRRRRARLQRLDVHGAGHHLDAIRTWRRAVAGAIGALKGPLARRRAGRGRQPAARDRLASSRPSSGSATTLDRGERLMGFGHRVYRAYDPRAAALREVAEGHGRHGRLARQWPSRSRTIALRVLAELKPDRADQDQRRVLRGGRAAGRGPAAGPVPGHVRAGAPRRLDGALPRAGRREPC